MRNDGDRVGQDRNTTEQTMEQSGGGAVGDLKELGFAGTIGVFLGSRARIGSGDRGGSRADGHGARVVDSVSNGS